MSEPEQPPDGTGVGRRLGGWARRVGELVIDATTSRPSLPERLRAPLDDARARRLSGDPTEALAGLRQLATEQPDEPFVLLSIGFTLLFDLVAGGRPLKALGETTEALAERLGRGPHALLRGAQALFEGRPDPATDDLRRALGGFDRLTPQFEVEAQMWQALLSGTAYLLLGRRDRAFREFQKARLRLPPETGPRLRQHIVRHGVELALALGRNTDAELWVRDVLLAQPPERWALELKCRVSAAQGDRVATQAILDRLGTDVEPGTRLWVGLTLGHQGQDTSLASLALAQLQRTPEDPSAQRLWALAELRDHERDPGPMSPSTTSAVLDALSRAAKAAPRTTADAYLRELAHVALRLWALDVAEHSPVADRLSRDPVAPQELRLLRAVHQLRRGQVPAEDFVGDPPRFRGDPEVDDAHGPDPLSPLRREGLRRSVLDGYGALASAHVCLIRGSPELAQDFLVEALTHRPDLEEAQRRLAALALPEASDRLEDLLDAATRVLASAPHRVAGVALDGVQFAMRLVVAARERLARPLTIAIMGEFSAGKSTFVNTLLGEAVAPMGVLPTTTTINVFRRGMGRGARVHYRDGEIGVIKGEDLQSYLQGIDDTEASRIRHIEIERTGARMGEAAVVDTPGLNALDEFHEEVAREFLEQADAVVWVFSATRGGAASEAEMLGHLRQSGRRVLGILNKVDTLDPPEQEELRSYLADQLGRVLADVVPLRGLDALAWRTTPQPQGDDPFAEVESALERHFLSYARDLKHSLTARRLAEALEVAERALEAAATELEHRAEAAPVSGSAAFGPALARFADRVASGILEVDDTLTRESLGLGVVRTGHGLVKPLVDPLDAEYLEARFRDACLAAVEAALAEVSAADPVTGDVLDRDYVPWVQGYLEGLVVAEFVPNLVRMAGRRIVEGEAAARMAFREGLSPIASTCSRTARGSMRRVEHAHARASREARSAPRAEAKRLRSTLGASVKTLRRAAEKLAAVEVPGDTLTPDRPRR